MKKTQVTSTGIAVALAVAIALALLFFGPTVLTPFAPKTVPSELDAVTLETLETTNMEQGQEGTNPAEQIIQGKLPTELTGYDVVVGTGAAAETGKTVTVNYVGTLPDGTVFDASAKHGQAFTFPLGGGQVIKGWDLGVVGMKEGGKRKLIIPPSYGYGDKAVGNVIPANATLIFEIELLKVQ
jgi:FKBP-type peptidyl-prolyl cis-trans isomerase